MNAIDFVLLIPCYNNQNGLLASLKSISYLPGKCEILIVDDGSAVPINQAELQPYTQIPVHVIRLEKNAGILNALNTGLNFLKQRTDVQFIARLDAGDVCDEQRFYKQVEFLNAHTDVALLASWARFENIKDDTGYDYITRTKHEDIRKEMHYKCSFIHPSVMFRKEVIERIGVYPGQYPHAEDYAFFWKIMKMYKGAVLPEKLVTIGFSDQNVSSENYRKQLNSRKQIVKDFGENPVHRFMGLLLLNLRSMLPSSVILKLKSR